MIGKSKMKNIYGFSNTVVGEWFIYSNQVIGRESFGNLERLNTFMDENDKWKVYFLQSLPRISLTNPCTFLYFLIFLRHTTHNIISMNIPSTRLFPK